MNEQTTFYENMLISQHQLKDSLEKDGYASLEIMEAIEIEIQLLQNIVNHTKKLFKNRDPELYPSLVIL